jgi:hypothetical protein
MPPGAVYVGRPTLWGNPWSERDGTWLDKSERRAFAVAKYREELTHFGLVSDYDYIVSEKRWEALSAELDRIGCKSMADYAPHVLRGKDLACWCGLCELHVDGLPLGVECPDCDPCHADVLLELANR